MKEVKGKGRWGVRFMEEGREWRLLADNLVLCGESEDDLLAMVGRFIKVCRRGLKVNAGKSRVIVLNGEEELECKVHVDGDSFRVCLGI